MSGAPGGGGYCPLRCITSGAVHAGGGDGDQDLALAGDRNRPVLDLEHLRPARLADRDRPHRRRMRPSRPPLRFARWPHLLASGGADIEPRAGLLSLALTETQHMSFLDDDRPKKKPTAQPGENLADLSVEELKARIAIYQDEIERLEARDRGEGEAPEGGRVLLPALSATAANNPARNLRRLRRINL